MVGADRQHIAHLELADAAAQLPAAIHLITGREGGVEPVGFQNSATSLDLGFYAARSYSLMSPPSTARRLIRLWLRSATG